MDESSPDSGYEEIEDAFAPGGRWNQVVWGSLSAPSSTAASISRSHFCPLLSVPEIPGEYRKQCQGHSIRRARNVVSLQ